MVKPLMLFGLVAALAIGCTGIWLHKAMEISHIAQGQYPFANIRQGQTLSGDAPIVVTVKGSIDLLDLWIDGRKYGGHNAEDEGAGRYVAFNIPTYDYVNGPHVLEVGVGQHTIFDRRTVRFSNNSRKSK